MTTRQAAEILQLHPVTIVRMIRRGELQGHKKTRAKNSPYLVETESVNSYRTDQAQARA